MYTAEYLTTHRGIFYLHGTILGALCAHGFFGFVGTTGVLSASVSDFVVWDGYREVGSIPDELLLGQRRVFSI
jgi:hypothetical protein